MPEIDLLAAIAQVGFPMGVAVWLLWKGHTQDKEYLAVLVQLKTLLERHIETKEKAIALLEAKLSAQQK